VDTGAYRSVWGLGAARRVLILGSIVRIPLWAANVVLTLHIVSHLHRSYAAAGLVVTASTVALAASGPWRGRRLDRVGLRSTIAPCLVVLAGCWAVAPFAGYRTLMVLAFVAGLFAVPVFSVIRQALMASIPAEQRRAALSVDSVMVEISFMIGPPLGVLLASTMSTAWALFLCQYASLAGGLLLWAANPSMRGADAATTPAGGIAVSFSWRRVAGLLAMSGAAVLVLTGTEVSTVAALRSWDHSPWIGAELAVWGLGSALGGLVYGALHRPIAVPLLLGGLGAVTLPLGVAPGPVALGALLFLAGSCCAPTITATVDTLSSAGPDHARGEALGWHGAAMTAGGALGAPLTGMAIDHSGWQAGFVVPALIGVAVAAVVAWPLSARRPELETAAP
jgi:predicted MFS family arabinose efflux permease